jgi:hypothetical protein
MSKKRLGELLVAARLIDQIQLTVALGMQKQSKLKLGRQLLKLGFVRERDLSHILKEQLGIRLTLADGDINPEAVKAVPEDLAFKHMVMPVAYDGKTIMLAMEDPSNLEVVDALGFHLGKRIRPVRALEWDIENALLKYYHDFSDDELGQLTTKSKSAEAYEKAWSMDAADSIDPLVMIQANDVTDRIGPGAVPESSPQAELTAEPVAAGEAVPMGELLDARPLAEPVHDVEFGRKTGVSEKPAVSPSGPSPIPAASPLRLPQSAKPSPTQRQAETVRPPAQAQPSARRPVAAAPPSGRKATLQQALIDLLIEKGIISERELLRTYMRLEGKDVDG